MHHKKNEMLSVCSNISGPRNLMLSEPIIRVSNTITALICGTQIRHTNDVYSRQKQTHRESKLWSPEGRGESGEEAD